MDAELEDYLDAMRASLEAAIRSGDEETRRFLGERIDGVEARVYEQGRILRQEMQEMEARLTGAVQGRREDIDAAFRDITDLQKRVQRLETRG